MTLTQKGRDKVQVAIKSGWKLVETVTSCCSEEELEVFIGFIERMREKIFSELTPGKRPEGLEELEPKYYQKIARLFGGP